MQTKARSSTLEQPMDALSVVLHSMQVGDLGNLLASNAVLIIYRMHDDIMQNIYIVAQVHVAVFAACHH